MPVQVGWRATVHAWRLQRLPGCGLQLPMGRGASAADAPSLLALRLPALRRHEGLNGWATWLRHQKAQRTGRHRGGCWPVGHGLRA
jgi:hypothetical protein